MWQIGKPALARTDWSAPVVWVRLFWCVSMASSSALHGVRGTIIYESRGLVDPLENRIILADQRFPESPHFWELEQCEVGRPYEKDVLRVRGMERNWSGFFT